MHFKLNSKLVLLGMGLVLVLVSFILWRMIEDPFPPKALVSETIWQLDYVLIDGETQQPFEDAPYVQFTSSHSYRGFDGCNHFCWAEQPQSMLEKLLGTPRLVETSTTLLFCVRDTNTFTSGEICDFEASLHQVVSYEVSQDELRLGYSPNGSRIMVFRPVTETITIRSSCP
jgi:hypothetical protein